jgi:hypothetical protein
VADPVSWLLIAPGWRVVAADGEEVGRVERVLGDQSRDIFDGLEISTKLLGKPRYVPAEQVGQIVDGFVSLRLSGPEAQALPEYEPPR